ncbi:MAG: hypothetical protein MJY97_11090 [Bacteroidales bacterium]|nr:hypothetical protein [Bacteroidales bacterium]
MKKIIVPFVLDVLVATAGTYAAVSQLLDGFRWEAVAVLATLTGANVFAAFKLASTGKLRYSSTVAAGVMLIGLMIYMSMVSGIGALSVIGVVVGCAQIVIAIVAHNKDADSSEVPQNVKGKLPLLAARCVALGIGLGVLSLLPGHDIDVDKAVWLMGLAITLLAITRIAEMKDNDD